MATEGTTRTGTYKTSQFYLNWQVDHQSTSGNYTVINWQAGLYISGYDQWYSNAIRINAVWIAGTKVMDTTTVSNKTGPGTFQMGSGQHTLYHASDGTCSFASALDGWLYSNHDLASGDVWATLPTIPRNFTQTPHIALSNATETTVSINWSTSETRDWSQYSLNGGSWTDAGDTGNTSGTINLSGLSPNTTYTLKCKFRRADSQLWSESNQISISTYAYPYITNSSNFTVGNQNKVSFYNPLGRNVTIKVQPNGSSTWYSGGQSTGTSMSGFNDSGWRDIWYQYCTNKTSNTYRVRLTYGNHTNTTGYSYTYTISESANSGECKPSFSNFTCEDVNSTILALTGDSSKVVLGYSNIKATISTSNKATANKYASMSSYKMIIDGHTPVSVNYSSSSSVNMTISGVLNNTVTVSASDSRGFSRNVSKSLTNVGYTSPIIDTLNAKLIRSNNGVGELVTLQFSGTYWNQNFGIVTNTIKTLKYQYKATSDNNYSSEISIINDMSTSGNTFSYNHLITGPTSDHGYDISTSYNIKINWSDELSSGSFVLTLGAGTPKIAIAQNGVAINQKYDTSGDGTLQVNGNILLAENNFINGISSSTGNTHHLIRATDGYSALGDHRYKTGIWGSNIVLMAPMSIANSGTEGQGITNGSGVSIIRDHNNQNVTVDATGNGLYLGFEHTNFINLLNNKGFFDSYANLSIDGNVYVGNKNNKVATEGFVTEYTGGGILRLPSGTSYSDARATGKTCMWQIANNMPSDGPSANTNYGLAMVINPTGSTGDHFATVGIFVSDWHSTLYVRTANGGWVSK